MGIGSKRLPSFYFTIDKRSRPRISSRQGLAFRKIPCERNLFAPGVPGVLPREFFHALGFLKRLSRRHGRIFRLLKKSVKGPIHEIRRLDTNRDGQVCFNEAINAFVQAAQKPRKKAAQVLKLEVPVYGFVKGRLSPFDCRQ